MSPTSPILLRKVGDAETSGDEEVERDAEAWMI